MNQSEALGEKTVGEIEEVIRVVERQSFLLYTPVADDAGTKDLFKEMCQLCISEISKLGYVLSALSEMVKDDGAELKKGIYDAVVGLCRSLVVPLAGKSEKRYVSFVIRTQLVKILERLSADVVKLLEQHETKSNDIVHMAAMAGQTCRRAYDLNLYDNKAAYQSEFLRAGLCVRDAAREMLEGIDVECSISEYENICHSSTTESRVLFGGFLSLLADVLDWFRNDVIPYHFPRIDTPLDKILKFDSIVKECISKCSATADDLAVEYDMADIEAVQPGEEACAELSDLQDALERLYHDCLEPLLSTQLAQQLDQDGKYKSAAEAMFSKCVQIIESINPP